MSGTIFDPNASPEEVIKIQEEVSPQKGPGLVPSWSFSALQNFEACPYRVFLSRVKKFEEPESEALIRGKKIHDEAEHFVRGTGDLTKNLEKFAEDLEIMRDRFAAGEVEAEENWGFDHDWAPSDWKSRSTWCRMKLDLLHRDDTTSARVIDHKTGKKFGNEIKHGDQGLLYGIGTFMRYPEIQFLTVEFWYLDIGEKLIKTYNRQRGLMMLPRYTQRALAMTTATRFEPRPSRPNCKWCPHKETGNCEWAVD